MPLLGTSIGHLYLTLLRFFENSPILYKHESDSTPKAGVTTVGRIIPHGAIGNSSTVIHPLAGSTCTEVVLYR